MRGAAAGAIRASLRVELGGFRLDATFDAPGRGVTAVFGASGAGKTTLLRCLAGLEPTARGRLEVNGKTWQDSERGAFLPPHRRELGYVLQEAGLFAHLTVAGNLDYALRRRTAAARGGVDRERAVAWLGIAKLLDRRPDRLSGGERQRVAIARALLAGRRLLLMDEPLSALDEPSRLEILPCLDRLQRELAVPIVYVSHSRAEVLRLADHVLLLEHGRVRAAGPVNEIAARRELAAFDTEETLGTVTEAVVAACDEPFGLTYLDFGGGRLAVPATGLRIGERRRVRFLARDVSLTLDPPTRTSILNIIPARVVRIDDADAPLPLVTLDAGGAVLLARITRKSLVNLELRVGAAVRAQIKSVALLP